MYRHELAALVGLSSGAVFHCEDGVHVPKLSTVERIADALGISPTWLAYGDEGPLRFKPRRPRPALPLDPPVPEPDSRPARDLWRGVAERLAYARTTGGLSLRQIAEAAGVSRQTVLLIERGHNEPLISTVEALAVALGVSPGWLAFGEGEGPEATEQASA
jgi:transcriptional regulator with XRE-family HTH domain